MRLAPIDKPPTLLARLLFAVLKRMLGRVPTPYAVVFARMPQALFAHAMMVGVLDRRLTIDHDLRVLIESHVATLNGCTFCLDIVQSMALRRSPGLGDKLARIADYRSDPAFSDRERAALAYVESATRERRVDDLTFAALRRHCSEREIVEITWVNALEQYFNTLNISLGIGSDGFCALPVVEATAKERLTARR